METNIQTIHKVRQDVLEPSMYAVILFNDEITTMDFVVALLVKIFNKQPAEASSVMMDIHQKGQGVAGVYTYDIAVTKKAQSEQLAIQQGFPLRLTLDEIYES